MTLTPTFTAICCYAERILGIHDLKSSDLARVTASLQAEFATYEVTLRQLDRSRIIVSPSGVHAALTCDGILVTVFTPGVPVKRCWCTHCCVARAPHTRRTDHHKRRCPQEV